MKKELHVISNGRLSFQQLGEMLVQIIDDIDYVHIREREKSTKELYEGVGLLLEKGVLASKLVINDRIDIALLTNVSRVQLGYRSVDVREVKRKFPYLHVGCSVHSFDEAVEAERKGADAVLYGHVFETCSKKGVPPKGLDELKQIARQLVIPVVAIGGIVPENVKEVLQTGAAGVAVMSGILDTDNPVKRTKKYFHFIKGVGV